MNTKAATKLEFMPVTSSTIQAYARDSNSLFLKFTNGGTYKYVGVSDKIITEFAKSASKGKYFATNIRSKFDATKV